MTPFLGEIAMVGFNFAPVGWAFCNGELLAINQSQALFTLIGTTYGGDGINTFALPDMRSRVPVHGSNDFVLGQSGGQESVTLDVAQIPPHNHILTGNLANASLRTPSGAVLATPQRDVYNDSEGSTLNPAAIAIAGANQAHSNIQPYLAVSFIIALQGIFPTHG